jgi:hypothetical protein
VGPVVTEPADPVVWIAEEHDGDRVGFRIGRTRSLLVAEFVGVGTLEATPDGRSTSFVPAPGASPELAAKVERGLVRSLIAHLRSGLAFHASAAARNGRAVVCLGPSEAGKSTAIAELCQRPDVALLADDAVILERSGGGFDVPPTEDSHWLLGASASALGFPPAREKSRLSPRFSATRPARLGAICRLLFDDAVPGPRLRKLHGQSVLETLSAAAIRFVIDDPVRQMMEFDQLSALAQVVDVYELVRPRDLGRLAQVGDLLEGLLDR